jgi:hypothetical protein
MCLFVSCGMATGMAFKSCGLIFVFLTPELTKMQLLECDGRIIEQKQFG